MRHLAQFIVTLLHIVIGGLEPLGVGYRQGQGIDEQIVEGTSFLYLQDVSCRIVYLLAQFLIATLIGLDKIGLARPSGPSGPHTTYYSWPVRSQCRHRF